jgi:RNA polymerase-binding transcription factor DksA
MGFFGSSKKKYEAPEWLAEMNETKERFFTFLGKLEEKMDELGNASVPELKAAMNEDTEDVYNRAYGRMLSGVKGQFENIREKASNVKDDKIEDFHAQYRDDIEFDNPYRKSLDEFRTECRERYNVFDKKFEDWREALDETSVVDMEVEYKKILNDFDKVKDKFSCKQCGAKILIEKIFTRDVYVTCNSCQTQNTFQPSSTARGLEHVAGQLALQRAGDAYNAYDYSRKLERDLYHQRHELSLSRIGENDQKLLAEIESKMANLEQKRQDAIASEPVLYEKFILKKYEEWIKIVPDDKEHLLTRMENELNNR